MSLDLVDKVQNGLRRILHFGRITGRVGCPIEGRDDKSRYGMSSKYEPE
jgi:hypothetical protein